MLDVEITEVAVTGRDMALLTVLPSKSADAPTADNNEAAEFGRNSEADKDRPLSLSQFSLLDCRDTASFLSSVTPAVLVLAAGLILDPSVYGFFWRCARRDASVEA